MTGLTRDLNGLQTSIANMTKQQQAFLTSTDNLTRTFGKSRTEVLAMKAEMLGISSAAAPMIGTLKQMGIDGEHSFAHMIQSGGVFRELIVLIHESLIMGNWSRFGGSMMVLAERTGLSASIFTGFGAAVLGGVAAVGGLVAAMITGEMESSRFARAISLTGNMAGITENEFNVMAETIGNQVPGSVLKARNALQALISTGQFSGDTLAAVGRAAVEFSQYSGQTAAEVVKDFDGMSKGVAKWAEEHNKQYHFLTAAQYEYIASLEQQGQIEQAEQAVANDMYQHLAQTGTQNLGILERAWDSLGAHVRAAWNDMQNIGRAQTPEEQLAALLPQQKSIDTTVANDKQFASPQLIAIRDRIDAQVTALRAQIKAATDAAKAAAHNDQMQQDGIAAHNFLLQYLPPPDVVKTKIAELKKSVTDALKVNPNDPQALAVQSNMNQIITDIEKKYGHQKTAGGGLNKPDANGYSISGMDPAKISNQVSLMKEYAAATHQSESAVLQLNIAAGKLAGFTAKQIAELKAKAAADDQLAAQKAATALEGKYQTATDALSTKKTDLTNQLNQMMQLGSVTKQTELAMINLKIAQGDLKGIPQSEIDSIRALAMQDDALTAAIAKQKITGLYGTQQAFSDYVAKATDAGTQMKKVWTDTFTGMEDIMITMLEGGKVNWDKYALSVVNDMLKMEIESRILGPLINALGGIGGGTNGSGLFNILGGIMSGVGSGGAMSTASLIAHQGGASSIFSGIGGFISHLFANGGIMTAGGSLPLNRYANGGVANTPQLAMFGEGRGPEAYVPLPDGRSIPVSMRGGSGGGQTNHIQNNISIASDGSSQTTPQQASAMARGLTYAIQQELIKQQRDGGLFSSTSGIR
ncbi:MAG TPA: phage tail length tape measure family protein [Acidocella sp.]|nr:phage tail length tape measure family protein [Acidocella sp.]